MCWNCVSVIKKKKCVTECIIALIQKKNGQKDNVGKEKKKNEIHDREDTGERKDKKKLCLPFCFC